jgi:16S rRNA (uracil1498-N3)-methyltransferase
LSAGRFFIEGTLELGASRELFPSDARKVVLVLRKRSGDAIEVVDSAGRTYRAELTIDGTVVRAKALELLAEPREAPIELTIAQGLPKGQKMDYVVEKATELGVAALIPLQSERVVGTRDGKLDRWRRIARAAAQQSGRTRIPAIMPVHRWPELIERFGEFDRVLMPWEIAEPRPLAETLPGIVAGAHRVLAVIGPEGGFGHDEARAAIAAGAHPISLGRRILRTETAGLVLAAALLYELRAL